MHAKPKSLKFLLGMSLLLLSAFVLSACGAIPANNYAGLSSDSENVYMASSNFVYAVDQGTGTVAWKFPTKAEQAVTYYGAPAVADGWLYAASYSNVAYGFALSGIDPANPTPAWVFDDYKDKGRMIAAPVVVGDLVFFSSTDHFLYAIDRETGTLRWKKEVRDALWAPASSDGKLVFQAGMDHYLYAFNLSDGELAWEVDLEGPIISGITRGEDGILYVGTLNQQVFAVDSANGNILWDKVVEGNVWSAPLLYEGNLYFGTDAKKIHILSASNGNIVKTVDSAGAVIAAPVYTDGAILYSTEEGEVFTLDLAGENKIWTRTVEGKLYSTPVVLEDQIVLAPYQGKQILVGYDFSGNLDEKWAAVTGK